MQIPGEALKDLVMIELDKDIQDLLKQDGELLLASLMLQYVRHARWAAYAIQSIEMRVTSK